MNCLFASYHHAACGLRSECNREDKHHHHLSPADVEVISPGTGEDCWKGLSGKGYGS